MRYVEQKKKVSEMVRESIREYERGLTEEIKSNGSRRKLWHNLDRLRRKRRMKGEIKVYDEDGNVLENSVLPGKIEEFWKGVYQMHDSDINEVWNERVKGEYVT